MINTRIGAVQRAHLVRRPFRRAALVAPILAMSSYSAWADCPNVPNGSVYAYACSQANDGNGVAIQISGGAGTVSTSGLAGIDTAPLGGSNASRAFLNGQFGITGTNGQVSTTDSVNFSNAYGSGSATATAGMGDKYNATLNTIPFANGNPAVSQQRLNTNVVIPSLHASASGSSFGSSGGGPTVPSSGEDFFSDILSITQAQLNAFNQEFGGNHSTLFVSFSYAVSGTVNASPDTVSSPSVGTAGASFGVTVSNALTTGMENTSAGGSVSVTRFGTTDDLLGQLFTVTGQISPTNPLLIQANLEANGNASSSNGIGASYSANVSDTAQFLGVSFFADAAETIPVPDVQLGSALGFDYIPADAVLSPPTTAVPEISTWAMMLAGFSGLAAAALARDRKAAVT